MDHDPFDAVSVCPCCAIPLIVGSAVFTGANGRHGLRSGWSRPGSTRPSWSRSRPRRSSCRHRRTRSCSWSRSPRKCWCSWTARCSPATDSCSRSGCWTTTPRRRQRVALLRDPADRRQSRVRRRRRRRTPDRLGLVGGSGRRPAGVGRGHDHVDRLADIRGHDRVAGAGRPRNVVAAARTVLPLVAVAGRAVGPRPVGRRQRLSLLRDPADRRQRGIHRRQRDGCVNRGGRRQNRGRRRCCACPTIGRRRAM